MMPALEWQTSNMANPTRATITPASKEHPMHTVMVQELKHNTLRGDTYWVTREVREYRLRADAEKYAARFNTAVDQTAK